jgi:tetratricopeptide (TPR) repeat protein
MQKIFILTLLLIYSCRTSYAGGFNIESVQSQKKLQLLTATIRQHPDKPEPYVDRAKFWFEYEALNRAKADLHESLRIRPTAKAYFWLGKASASPPDNKETMAYFAKARSFDPDDFETLISLGNEYNSMKQYDKAEEAFGAALKAKSLPQNGDIFVHSWRAQAFLQHKKYARSLEDADFVISRAPKVVPVNKLTTTSENLHTPPVVAVMQSAYLTSLRTRALAVLGLGDYKKALDYLNIALRAAPGDSKSLDARALCYDKLGCTELAAKDRKTKKEQMTFFYDNALFSSDKEK